MKLSYLSLLALAPLAASAAEQYWVAPTNADNAHWVKGFSLDNPASWADADKLNNKNPGTPAGNEVEANGEVADGPLCWAAAAANIAAQWEARNVETVRETQGRDPKSAEEIFEDFTASVKSQTGTLTAGTRWYFVGGATQKMLKEGASNEGNYTGNVDYSVEHMDFLNTTNNGWTMNEAGAPFVDAWDESAYDRESVYRQWTAGLVDWLEAGYSIGLGVQGIFDNGDGTTGSYGHAVTLWGVEVNEKGLLTRMWLTDSDDATNAPMGDMGLFSVSCTLVDLSTKLYLVPKEGEVLDDPLLPGLAGHLSLQSDVDYNGYNWYNAYNSETGLGDYVSDIYAVKVTSRLYGENAIVPEPATATLSLLALAGLCARRRRH